MWALLNGSEKYILKPGGLPRKLAICYALSNANVASCTILNLINENLGNNSISSTMPKWLITWPMYALSIFYGMPPSHNSLTIMLQGFSPTIFSLVLRYFGVLGMFPCSPIIPLFIGLLFLNLSITLGLLIVIHFDIHLPSGMMIMQLQSTSSIPKLKQLITFLMTSEMEASVPLKVTKA